MLEETHTTDQVNADRLVLTHLTLEFEDALKWDHVEGDTREEEGEEEVGEEGGVVGEINVRASACSSPCPIVCARFVLRATRWRA